MHIPDGFFSVQLAAWGWLIALPALIWALIRVKQSSEQDHTLAAFLAACLFAVQTFQFPVPGGTTGHLVGATLVVILTGPGLGLLVLTSVVGLQALVFGEGGLLVLGWNLTNMGLASGWVGGCLYQLLRARGASLFLSAFASAWLATLMGSFCTALELAFASITPLSVSLAAMLGVQVFMGACEGFITASTLAFLLKHRPNLVVEQKGLLKPGLVIVALMILASFCISSVSRSSATPFLAPAAFSAILAIFFLLWLGVAWRKPREASAA